MTNQSKLFFQGCVALLVGACCYELGFVGLACAFAAIGFYLFVVLPFDDSDD